MKSSYRRFCARRTSVYERSKICSFKPIVMIVNTIFGKHMCRRNQDRSPSYPINSAYIHATAFIENVRKSAILRAP